MTDWRKQAEEFIGNLPSPLAPGLTNKEFPTAVKLATYTRGGGVAAPHEAEGFWGAFKNMNQQLEAQGKHPFSPDDYREAYNQLAPLSHAYANRPPTMREIATYGNEHPSKQRDFYASLPDQTYPHITNGQAVKMHQAALPHAQQNLGRPPVKSEVVYLVHSGEDPSAYYQRAATTQIPLGTPAQQQQPQLSVVQGGQRNANQTRTG